MMVSSSHPSIIYIQSHFVQVLTSSQTFYPHPDSDLGLVLGLDPAHPSDSSLAHPYCHPYVPVPASDLAPALALAPAHIPAEAEMRTAADHTQSIHHHQTCYQVSNNSAAFRSKAGIAYLASHTSMVLIAAAEPGVAVDVAVAAVVTDTPAAVGVGLSDPSLVVQVAADVAGAADAAESGTVAMGALAAMDAAAVADAAVFVAAAALGKTVPAHLGDPVHTVPSKHAHDFAEA